MKITVAPIWEFEKNKDKYTKIISISETNRHIESRDGHPPIMMDFPDYSK